MLKIKTGKLVNAIWPLVLADIPVFIRGKTGVGKSQMIREGLVPKMREHFNMDVVLHDYRLSSKDITDGTGIPVVADDPEGKRTVWTRPAFIPVEDGKMHLIFLDEIGHASVQMQHAVGYQLTQDRALGEYKLPKNNRLILAMNMREDKGGDNKLAKPFEGRGAWVELADDPLGFLEYMTERKFNPHLIAFLKLRPQLYHKMADGPTFPMPRRYEQLNRVMNIEGIKNSEIEDAATALVGEGVSAELAGFLKHIAAHLPRLSEIKANPMKAKVPQELDLQYVVAMAIAQQIKPEDADTWAKYLGRLEADIRSAAAHNAIQRDKKLEKNKALDELVLK